MSCFDMVKFEKGQIWKICFKDKTEVKGREQDKDRPWIILSTRKFNQSSGMITAAPLTTRDSIVSPSQVMFTDMRGKNSVVLCEQIRTFDYKSGFYEMFLHVDILLTLLCYHLYIEEQILHFLLKY